MVVARRLLVAGGGATFAVLPLTVELTTAPDGAWTHANAPKAVQHDGVIYFGYVDMTTGNLEVRSHTLGTGVTSSAFVIATAFEVDSHASPALIVRSDGRLLVVYSKHQGTGMFRRVSTNVLPDISSFGSEGSLDATLGGTTYTYPTLVSYDGDIWLFYRDDQDTGTTAVLCYSVSTDDGATWSAQTELYESPTRRSYWMVASTGTRIDIVTSDGRNPPDSGDVPIYHFWYDGTWRASDGTSIGSPIFNPADLTEVYDSADGMGWPQGIAYSGSNPTFVYGVLDQPTSNSYRRAIWTGSEWVNSTIADSDGVIEAEFSSNPTIDTEEPDIVYAPVEVGGVWEMYAFRLDGSTWVPRAMTSGSSVDQLNPAPVLGHDGRVRVLWLSGTYTTFLDMDMGIIGGR